MEVTRRPFGIGTALSISARVCGGDVSWIAEKEIMNKSGPSQGRESEQRRQSNSYVHHDWYPSFRIKH